MSSAQYTHRVAQGAGRGGFGSQQVAILLCVLVLSLSAVAAVFVLAPRFRPPEQVLDTSAVPEQFRDQLLRAGERCAAVEAPLLAAQIEAESGWQPSLVTARGFGLAQLSDAVYRDYGVDDNHNNQIDQLDPSDAIATQANYLCSLSDQVAAVSTDSDAPITNLTLAAFHVGPKVVIEGGGKLPGESDAYVQRVLALVSKYTTFAKVEQKPQTTGDWVIPVAPPVQHGTPFWQPGPLWRWKGHHTGVDFPAVTGTEIYAAGAGVISTKQANGGAYGNYIVIQHGVIDGKKIETLYAHMSRFADVSVGQHVKPGELIGYVGATGNVTGPHLHFEVHQNWTGGGTNDQFLDGFAWLDAHR